MFVISCGHNAKIREEGSLAQKLFEARSNRMVIESKNPIPFSFVTPPSPDVPLPPPDVPPAPVPPPSGEQKDIIDPIDLNMCLIELDEIAVTKEQALKQFYEVKEVLYEFKHHIKGNEPVNSSEGEGFPFLVFNEIFDIREWDYSFNSEIIYGAMRYNSDLIYALAFAIYTMYPPRSVFKSDYHSMYASDRMRLYSRYQPAIKNLLNMF
ncbi:hypothetical protein R5397_00025 [Borrelia sp. MN22-0132]|uniref:hypothetical protein n=1 Tax=Borrelia sp. MN22-0132 TaxID=3085635 RepID=UPI003B9E3888